MDPDACLRELLELAVVLQRYEDDDARRLAELATALDEWLAKGGFPPDRWRAARTVKVELRDVLDRRGRTTEVLVGGQVLSRHPSSVSQRAAREAAELATRTLVAAGVPTEAPRG